MNAIIRPFNYQKYVSGRSVLAAVDRVEKRTDFTPRRPMLWRASAVSSHESWLPGMPMPTTGRLRVTSGLGCRCGVRYAHTDIPMPNFDHYRPNDNKDACRPRNQTEYKMKTITALSMYVAGVTTLYCAKFTVRALVSSMGASKDVLALAQVEIDLSSIESGAGITAKWRGKPLYIWHRTQQDIDRERAQDISILRDPQTDEERFPVRPEWMILVQICTHLGCVPIPHLGDFHGFYCPCHGSHFDGSGRARKGPAPSNLEIPAYSFVDDNTVVVG